MKTAVIWGLIAAAIWGVGALLPFQSTDVAQLVPVETLVVSLKDTQLVLDGGTCRGSGNTWEEAWQDLQNSAEGHVFLGTAEQIVFAGAAIKTLPDAVSNRMLRPAANVCVSVGKIPDPKETSAYLSAHNGGITLQTVRAWLKQGQQPELPVLVVQEGGMRLYGREHG